MTRYLPMTKIPALLLAALFAALVGGAALAPAANAASIPAGATRSIDDAAKPQAEEARDHGRRGYSRRYYGRPRYAPRYYGRPHYSNRRCWTQPRIVWTPYGYARRMVRVCR